jgi:hypothetical protein
MAPGTRHALVQERALDRILRLYFSSPSVRIALLDDDRLAELGAAISPRPESDRQAASDSWPIAAGEPAFGALLRALTRDVSSKAGRWFVAPLGPVQADDAEQADRLSRLAGVLDSLPEAKRASAVEEFQHL